METPLAERKTELCVGKGGDIQPLKPEEIEELKKQLCPSWEVKDGKLVRTFVAKNFKEALAAVNKYGDIAEENSHHPDLHITGYRYAIDFALVYRRSLPSDNNRNVTIELSTHALKALSINDFVLAAKLDRAPVVYSPKFLKDNPSVTAGRE